LESFRQDEHDPQDYLIAEFHERRPATRAARIQGNALNETGEESTTEFSDPADKK
jgi:hypothetical protein